MSKVNPKAQTPTVTAMSNATRNPDGTYSETAGGVAHTWTNYTNAGGSQGPSVGNGQTIEIACVIQGFRVQDGNTNWYQIAQGPWSYAYYVSADAFYNNGQTSGSLAGTPFVDPAIPSCGSGGYPETAGGAANTWTNYTDAGGSLGPTIGGGSTVRMACKVQGFRVQDGNVWWYRIQDQPWNNQFYVSADAFYNNGQTSGSLAGTPFIDPNVPDCSSGSTGPPPTPGTNETAGGAANTWTDYSTAGGTQGPSIGGGQTVVIACKIQGFRVPDGNTYWYRIAQSPWNGGYYVSADAFYNNGQTSGSLRGTPFYDPAVSDCTGTNPGGTDPSTTPPGGANETSGGVAHTWTNYTNAGGTEGPDIASHQTVLIACKLNGFQVADGNTWWYLVAASPWNGNYYVSSDAFYNNGATSGSLLGTPFVDYGVADCATQSGGGSNPSSGHPSGETAGGVADTFGNYSHAGAPGPNQVPGGATIQVTCRAQGFRVADGNTWWYLIASSPWNNVYYVSADAFYNNGATSGSLLGTPFYDPSVPVCVNNSEAPLYATSYGSSHATTHTTSCAAADPVNCASGNFSHSFTDVAIGGRGPAIDITRTYNSLNPSSGALFGNGWSSIYDQTLNAGSPTRAADGSIVTNLEDGSQVTATPNGSGFSTPAATDTGFVANLDGTYTLTQHENLVETFSSMGQLVSIADLNGYQTTLSYDSSHHLSAITGASGRVLTVVVGSNGLVARVTDPLGRATTYTYDATNNLLSTSDPLGRTWRFTYDSNNRMLTMTDPRGGVVANAYDSIGRVTRQVDAAALATTFSYTGDNFGSLGGTTTITDPHGNVRVEQYASGFLTQVTRAFGTPAQTTWTYQYDPSTYGRTQVTDPTGTITHSTYDAHGRVLTSTDPTGATTTNTYNALEEATSTQTPLHEISSKGYDSAGNLVSSTDALGHVTTFSYGDGSHPGDLTAVTDPDGRTIRYTYDSSGDVATRATSPAAGITDTTAASFDADGERICQVSPNAIAAGGAACPAPGAARVANTTTTAFDAAGQVTSMTDPSGHATSYGYDADGNRVRVTDPKGDVTTSGYDADNRLVSTTGGANGSAPGTTTTAYDVAVGAGNCAAAPTATYCTTTTNPTGGVTVDYFDARDQKVREVLPGGQASTYAYDPVGNLLSATDAALRSTTHTYDADNRLTATAYSDGTTPTVLYGYDSDGRRTSMGDGTGTTSTHYDADSRATSVTNGAGAMVAYRYDSEGHVTTLIYPNGQTVTSTYDGAGRLASETDWLGHATTFGYDSDDNLVSTVYPNGDAVQSMFDRSDTLSTTNVGSSTSTLASVAYNRDPGGLITRETDGGALSGTTNYGYDAKNELTSANGTHFGFDSAGQLTSNGNATQAFNAAGQITSSTTGGAATTFAYDAVGDRVNVAPAVGPAINYRYDQAERLVAIAQVPPAVTATAPSSGPATGGTTVTITGTGFNAATGVNFGPLPASSYTVVSGTKITAVSPAQATNGANLIDIAVTTPAGTSPAGPADQFTYIARPSITGISPSSGSVAGGTTVTITGNGFTAATSVAFGPLAATSYTVVSATQITAVSPAQSAAGRNIYVTTPGGTSAATPADVFTTVTGPTVSSVAPTAGPTNGGTTITISGSGFNGATAVTFGALPATRFTVMSGVKLTAVSPQQSATVADVAVTTPGGTSSAVSADHFTYMARPTIAAVVPPSGTTAGGTTVYITGTGFTAATAVAFGPAAATSYTIVSDTQITAVSPPQSAATRNIFVTTPGGTNAAVSADVFSNVAGPAISGVSPSAGPTAGGTTVTIAGSGFTGATAVTFGSLPASSFTVLSGAKISAVAPAQGSGTVDLTVTTPGGATSPGPADQFTYASRPAMTTLSPTSGSTAGGTTVTITGTGLTGATAVNFGSAAAASFTVVSATQITAVSPPESPAARNVYVTTPGGTSAAVAGDVFSSIAPPAVTGVAPPSGSGNGGTTVTITGSGFTGATAVTFGSLAATNYSILSGIKITAVSPIHAPGTVDVNVTTAGGPSPNGAADQFSYTAGASPATAKPTINSAQSAEGGGAAPTASFSYNGDGLRTAETTAAGTTSFTWDTSRSVPVVLADGSNSYVYGPGGLPIEQIDTSNNGSYFFHDHNGTTRALLASDGSIGSTFTFNSYGAQTATTGTLKTALLYARSYADTVSGLLYLINRYYDPVTGQFMTIDPAVDRTGTPFGYAAGDPINNADPTGESATVGSSDANADAMYEMMDAGGFCDYMAAGIVGNLIYESHSLGSAELNPVRFEDGGGPGRGIAQWGIDSSRWQSLEAYAAGWGYSPWDLAAQLMFVVVELEGTHKRAAQAVQSSKNVAEATLAFMTYYEVPAAATANLAGRTSYAQQALAAFGGAHCDVG